MLIIAGAHFSSANTELKIFSGDYSFPIYAHDVLKRKSYIYIYFFKYCVGVIQFAMKEIKS